MNRLFCKQEFSIRTWHRRPSLECRFNFSPWCSNKLSTIHNRFWNNSRNRISRRIYSSTWMQRCTNKSMKINKNSMGCNSQCKIYHNQCHIHNRYVIFSLKIIKNTLIARTKLWIPENNDHLYSSIDGRPAHGIKTKASWWRRSRTTEASNATTNGHGVSISHYLKHSIFDSRA